MTPSPCPAGEFMDCAGACYPNEYKDDPSQRWYHDGFCDDGIYGIFFNCPAFNCDGGDCSASQCSARDPGETCMLAIEPDYYGTNSWILG